MLFVWKKLKNALKFKSISEQSCISVIQIKKLYKKNKEHEEEQRFIDKEKGENQTIYTYRLLKTSEVNG